MRGWVLLLFLCVCVSSCGIIHRGKNVARSIYTENTIISDYALAFAPPPMAPEIKVEKTVEEIEPESGEEARNPVAYYLPDDTTFDPLCLLNNIGTLDLPIHPTQNCGRENIQLVENGEFQATDAHIQKKFFITGTLYPASPDEADEIEPKAGAPHETEIPNVVGYTNLGTVKGMNILKTFQRMASGEHHTSLTRYDVGTNVRGAPTLSARKVFASGDRCAGGLENIQIDTEIESLAYSVNTTPFGLMAFPYIPYGSTPKARPYVDVDDCPTCCIGTMKHTDSEFIEFVIDEDYIRSVQPPKDDAEAQRIQKEKTDSQQCFDRILLAVFNQGHKSLTQREITSLVRAVEQRCLVAEKKEQ